MSITCYSIYLTTEAYKRSFYIYGNIYDVQNNTHNLTSLIGNWPPNTLLILDFMTSGAIKYS